MDNLTHSLVGAVLGQTGLKKKTGLAMPALIIGANLPDVDAACFFWLEGTEHLGFRRGITHGPPAWLLLPLMLAWLLWAFDRWQAKRGKRPEKRLPVSFKWLYLLGLLGCLTHPALDWLNVYGIRFLEPFSSQWFYGDTLFIIDVWLWGLFSVCLWLSLRSENRGGNWRRPAWAGIVLGLIYVGVNWEISKEFGGGDNSIFKRETVVIASPVPLRFWERELIIGEDGKYAVGAEAYAPIQEIGECSLEPVVAGAKGNSQAEAFLFWSRAPFAQRAEDGSIILHDARFYDPLARDRFSVALPDVECEELTAQ